MQLRYSLLLCLSLFAFFGLHATSIVAICEAQVNVSLPADACTVTITPDMIDAGSYSSTGSISRYVSGGYNRAPGTYTVFLNIVDQNNGSNSCWSTVVVEDKTTPVVTCTNQTIYLVAPDQPRVLNVDDMVSITDNCSTTDFINVTDQSGYGTSPFSASATDAAGNSGYCSGTVTLLDAEPQNYCSSSRNSYYEHINRIDLVTATNNQATTTGNSGGYHWHYPEGDNTLYHGYSYRLTYAPGFRSSSYHEYWRVYLDKNGDGDFTDSGELLHQWNGYGGNSFNFTSPGAFWGWSRIRVVMSYGGYASSCGGGYGETEDISVYLRPWFILPWPWGKEDNTNEVSLGAAPADVLAEERPTEAARAGEANQRIGLSPSQAISPVVSQPTSEAISVYPNPARGGEILNIRGLSEAGSSPIMLRDLTGRSIQSFTVSGGQGGIQLPANLPAGIYLLSGKEWTRRVVIR